MSKTKDFNPQTEIIALQGDIAAIKSQFEALTKRIDAHETLVINAAAWRESATRLFETIETRINLTDNVVQSLGQLVGADAAAAAALNDTSHATILRRVVRLLGGRV